MPIICGSCSQPCGNDGSDVKCSGGCDRLFHAACADLEGAKTRNRDWRCRECKKAMSLKSSVGSSSAQGTALTKEFILNVMESFKTEIFNELKSVRGEMNELSSSVQFLSNSIDSSNKLMAEIKTELVSIKKENELLKNENREMKADVKTLKDRLRDLEQYTRRANLEISGIPLTPKEEVGAIVKDVGKVLGIQMTDEQVLAAHRIPSFRRDREQSLVVQFQSKALRDMWITSYRSKKNITAKEVNPAYPALKVYINEHLSPENKLFLNRLKVKCKSIGYKYVWSRDGKFFVRKTEGDKCRRVNSFDDIELLK